MIYCLDTNVIIDATNNRKNMNIALSNFRNHSAKDIVVPSIVLAELEFGARHSKNYEQNISVSRKFVKSFKIIPFTEKEAEIYGKIRERTDQKRKTDWPERHADCGDCACKRRSSCDAQHRRIFKSSGTRT